MSDASAETPRTWESEELQDDNIQIISGRREVLVRFKGLLLSREQLLKVIEVLNQDIETHALRKIEKSLPQPKPRYLNTGAILLLIFILPPVVGALVAVFRISLPLAATMACGIGPAYYLLLGKVRRRLRESRAKRISAMLSDLGVQDVERLTRTIQIYLDGNGVPIYSPERLKGEPERLYVPEGFGKGDSQIPWDPGQYDIQDRKSLAAINDRIHEIYNRLGPPPGWSPDD
ncbi:hypothetical protein [Actinomadura sp. NEAU-AAG7]|uniref:hypothetical protein n=1 Tax=Actinomadura sp. NEAU-AAG7 TaxID=2839640 RepID=UPI001BE48F49|nr:hypothetical protein [Actinomadura sp. NEAU-AAG7]MBT2213469.1 hypothetical protein [Actinomadura sp. NEAU-AAG7]